MNSLWKHAETVVLAAERCCTVAVGHYSVVGRDVGLGEPVTWMLLPYCYFVRFASLFG